MEIEVLIGPPGCGKSTKMRRDAMATPGFYLFAMPTIALIKEQATAFRAEKPGLDLTEAHSKAPGHGSVQKRLDDALARIAQEGAKHAVILITHESLMGCRLDGFTDWHVRIDEAPNAIQSGKINAPASVNLLKQAISLKPVGSTGWAEIELANRSQSWRDLAADDLFKPLGEFMKQAARPHGAFVDTLVWKKSFGWCSLWTPTALSHVASVQIAGASYLTSLGAIVAERWEKGRVTFRPRPIKMVRSAQPNVWVHYFAQAHEGTSKLWDGHAGREFIVKICDFLAALAPPLGFWSGNEEVKKLMDWRVPGEPLPAKVAGLNEYEDRVSCAFIYSSKPLPGDATVKYLFGLTDDEILRAREDEDILQFVMRGAIRKRDFDGNYDI